MPLALPFCYSQNDGGSSSGMDMNRGGKGMGQKILLESGTNEVEILEFYLGVQEYGINIAKVAQIIPFDPARLTRVPSSHQAVLGALLWQDRTIPLIDLGRMLGLSSGETVARPIVLVAEFNSVVNGFLTDGVNRIHRLSWERLDPMSPLLEAHASHYTGSIRVESRDVLLIDFECIIAELFPETSIAYHDVGISPLAERGNKHVVFAEDSNCIRTMLGSHLRAAGYTGLEIFENGADALRYVEQTRQRAAAAGEPLTTQLDLVVNDIEMPVMDGLALCRRLKLELGLDVPVVIFSSLINEAMEQKCREVGADANLNKPRLDQLVEVMDHLLGIA